VRSCISKNVLELTTPRPLSIFDERCDIQQEQEEENEEGESHNVSENIDLLRNALSETVKCEQVCTRLYVCLFFSLFILFVCFVCLFVSRSLSPSSMSFYLPMLLVAWMILPAVL
jgi:hypothetical protein